MLDHVHRRHGEPGAVDDAADRAFQSDVIQLVLGRLRLARVLLRGVVHVGDLALAEHRVVVEAHLGVERDDAVVLGDDQRVDLEHGRVVVAEGAVAAQDRLHRVLDLLDVQAELEGDLARLEVLHADGGLDDHGDERVGLLLGDRLDLHAALLRGEHADALLLPVENEAEVELFFERVGDLDVDALDGLALGARLVRDERPAEHALGGLAHLVVGLAELDAAGLAARAGVDLRLDHPFPAAELGGGVDRLLGRVGDGAPRQADAGLGQELLGLVLVDIHAAVLP